jgi:hypothetical protein
MFGSSSRVLKICVISTRQLSGNFQIVTAITVHTLTEIGLFNFLRELLGLKLERYTSSIECRLQFLIRQTTLHSTRSTLLPLNTRLSHLCIQVARNN